MPEISDKKTSMQMIATGLPTVVESSDPSTYHHAGVSSGHGYISDKDETQALGAASMGSPSKDRKGSKVKQLN